MTLARLAASAALLSLGAPALAAPLVAAVSAKPNPASAGAEVALTVTIERPTPLDIQRCEVSVDPGDGSGALKIVYEIGDRRTKSVKHAYAKAGSFTVKATGDGRCQGSKESPLTVTAAGSRPAPKAEAPKCPAGWKLESQKADSFACRRL